MIKTMYEAKPHLIANNNLLWVELCKELCIEKGITNTDDFFINIINGDLPSSHVIAASITNVRKKYPHLRPTEDQMKRKLEVQQQYINDYRNV